MIVKHNSIFIYYSHKATIIRATSFGQFTTIIQVIYIYVKGLKHNSVFIYYSYKAAIIRATSFGLFTTIIQAIYINVQGRNNGRELTENSSPNNRRLMWIIYKYWVVFDDNFIYNMEEYSFFLIQVEIEYWLQV